MNPIFNFAPPELDFRPIMPILIVALTGIVALIAEMARPKRNNDLIVAICLGGLLLSGILLATSLNADPITTAAGAIYVDRFSAMMQYVVLVSTFLTVLFSEGYLREKKIAFGEFYPLVLWSSVGAMIMCATTNLLMTFLGLEILSVALYVMAGMSRSEEKSEESALKYFLLGAFASGFLLYGIAFLYGASGTLDVNNLALVWFRVPESHVLMIFGTGLILIGLGFKASLVPFHQWTPDVYQGAPTNVAAFMATASKVGAFAALVRILDHLHIIQQYWGPALAVLAVLTMTVGNLVALTQKDIKRILGYSSIAQAGYVLVAILSYEAKPGAVWIGTIPYYLLGYTAMTAGAFAIVSLCARNGKEATRLEDLHGLWKRSPFAAFALICFMASLIGLPPFVGFFGKLQILTDAVRADMTWLAVAMAINSIISVYYYLGIAKAAITSEGTETEARPWRLDRGVLGACVLSLIGVIGAVLPPVLHVFSVR